MTEVIYTRSLVLRRQLLRQLEALSMQEENERVAIVMQWKNQSNAYDPDKIVGSFRLGTDQECQLLAVWLPIAFSQRIIVAIRCFCYSDSSVQFEILGFPTARYQEEGRRAAEKLLARRHRPLGELDEWCSTGASWAG